MKVLRPLSTQEVVQLVNNAEPWSKEPVIALGDYISFFDQMSVAMQGLVIDGKPVYCGFAIPVSIQPRIIGLWTIIEKDTKHHFSIYAAAKTVVHAWANLFGKVYSYTDKNLPHHVEWVKRMGFVEEAEDEKHKILSLTGEVNSEVQVPVQVS